jgi:hypothetical protein
MHEKPYTSTCSLLYNCFNLFRLVVSTLSLPGCLHADQIIISAGHTVTLWSGKVAGRLLRANFPLSVFIWRVIESGRPDMVTSDFINSVRLV